ncbi:MAG: hypothetical protein J6T38_01775 [Bacteroidaceae bacterium]|nr:hypothetical protein [Bacteroidaceae bacterium]
MKKIIYLIVFTLPLLGMWSCNGNKTTEDASDSDSTTVDSVQTDDGKHNKEYIIQRLTKIYEMQDDSRCCSERYQNLFNEAQDLSEKGGMVFVDGDHWVQGNDIDKDWQYRILDVTDITTTTANATVLVNNFNEHEVMLKLVFERGDWYVDNFLTESEGGWGGPDAEPQIFDEAKDIQEFITTLKKDNEIAKKLIGEWGWVGDDVPELLLKFTMKDGTMKSLKAEECYLYRLFSFHGPLCGVYDGKVQIGQRPDNDAIDLTLELNEKGDELTGHIMVRLADLNYSYDGPITLRKNYFRYKDK